MEVADGLLDMTPERGGTIAGKVREVQKAPRFKKRQLRFSKRFDVFQKMRKSKNKTNVVGAMT